MIRLLTDPGRRSPGSFAARGASEVRASSSISSAREAADVPDSRADAAAAKLDFTGDSLRAARRLVAREAKLAGLSDAHREDLILAVDELTTNSVSHGGGRGSLCIWRTETAIVCEVRDGGHISDPLAGLRQPRPDQLTGRGLWVAGRLCDGMDIASSPGRTAVRVQMLIAR